MGYFGVFATLFLFVAGIFQICTKNIQTGLYLLFVSSLFYIGKAICLHGTQFERYTTFLLKILSKLDMDKIKANLKKKEELKK